MSLCQHCIEGTTWEGTPVGEIRTIGGVETYVSSPPQGLGDKTKVLLYFSDIFGLKLVNNKLLADDYARAGYHVYAPDIMAGDPISDADYGRKDYLGPFIGRHGKEKTEAQINPVMDALRAQGVTHFAAVGYCFGARYVTNYAVRKEIEVGILAHPSLLEVPKDLQDIKASGVPTYWATCETDPQYPIESQKIGDEILGNGTMEGPAYKRTYYPGCTHGFAVRGDKNDPKVKEGKEDHFKQSIAFLKKYNF